MDIEFIRLVEARAERLDAMDYFQVLGVAPGAGPADIKAAYYRESRAYHPDRYAALSSKELRALIGRVYRRVNEAYTVLRDDVRRQRYAADVAGPERAAKLRFTEVEETAVKEELKRKAEEVLGTTPNGRKLYASALEEIASQRWDAARRALKTALMYEPANARYLEALAGVEREKPKLDPYKIR